MSTTASDARAMASGSDHDVAVVRMATRPATQTDARLEGNWAPSTSVQHDPDELTVDQRSALRQRLEEIAALEASRVEGEDAAGFESLDAYDDGIEFDVADALAKMVAGSYGICETCQCPISFPRLKAVPYARRCLTCQEREENEWHHVQRLVGGVG
jgi:DnaK suppressor protein